MLEIRDRKYSVLFKSMEKILICGLRTFARAPRILRVRPGARPDENFARVRPGARPDENFARARPRWASETSENT